MPESISLYKIFISHAGKDTVYARMIGLLLERSEITYFLDVVSLEGGDIIKAEIAKEMQDSDEVVMILTPNSMNRPFVWTEFGMAIAYGKRITVLYHDLTVDDILSDAGRGGLLGDIYLMQLEDFERYLDQAEEKIKSATMWATIGHQKAINTLQRSFSEGRMSHAYLIAGPPNIGKMTLAMDMARMVNCLEQDKPCGKCAQCKRITDDLHADVQVIGLESQDSRDGRQRIAISIDKVREVQKEASLKPYEGAYRVFIFDGAEHLSEPAANALLKILEEPPDQVILALLVSETSAVLPTIASRCQTLDLRPLPPSLLAEELESKYDSDHDTAVEIARLSGGRPGWAITALSDSAILERRAEIIQAIEDTVRSPLEQRFAYAEKLANAFTRRRGPVYDELGLWLQWWRDLLVVKEGTPEYVTNISRTDTLRDIAESLSSAQVVSAINAVQESLEHLERNVNPRLALENLMLSLPWF